MLLFSFITEFLVIVACQPNTALIGGLLDIYVCFFFWKILFVWLLLGYTTSVGFVVIGLN